MCRMGKSWRANTSPAPMGRQPGPAGKGLALDPETWQAALPVGVIAKAFGRIFLPIVEFRTNPRGGTRQGEAEDNPPTDPKP